MMNGESKGIVQYGHDDFGNLAWVKSDDDHYDYRMPDKFGNLFKTPERKDQRYGPGGRLLESNGKKYTYDEEGNLISKTLVDGEKWHYEWSVNGMLRKVILPDKREVTFEYDATGRRTAKTYNGHITRWVWDGNTLLHEWKYAIERKPVSIVDNLGEIRGDSNEPLENLLTWIFTEGSLKPAAKLSSHFMQSIITDYLGTPVEMYDGEGRKTWFSMIFTEKSENKLLVILAIVPLDTKVSMPMKNQDCITTDLGTLRQMMGFIFRKIP